MLSLLPKFFVINVALAVIEGCFKRRTFSVCVNPCVSIYKISFLSTSRVYVPVNERASVCRKIYRSTIWTPDSISVMSTSLLKLSCHLVLLVQILVILTISSSTNADSVHGGTFIALAGRDAVVIAADTRFSSQQTGRIDDIHTVITITTYYF